MTKETSSRVSSLAAEILQTYPPHVAGPDVSAGMEFIDRKVYLDLLHKAKTLAGSCMSQDETPGQHKIPTTGIHPAPSEFSEAQVTADPILHFFHYAHLPPHLAATSVKFFYLAMFVIANLPRNPERTVALRKLLEAKDAAVRANLPAPSFKARVASSPELGEPVEIGGHDEDRDGPVQFGG